MIPLRTFESTSYLLNRHWGGTIAEVHRRSTLHRRVLRLPREKSMGFAGGFPRLGLHADFGSPGLETTAKCECAHGGEDDL